MLWGTIKVWNADFSEVLAWYFQSNRDIVNVGCQIFRGNLDIARHGIPCKIGHATWMVLFVPIQEGNIQGPVISNW